MREIKFRAKTINTSEWIESMTISMGTIKRKRDCVFFEIYPGVVRGVIPETVGEYIGLKDKNENEICEGDIVIITGHGIRQPFEVRYFAPSFHILCVPTNVHIPMSINSEYEIIGNIFDNYELLVPKI